METENQFESSQVGSHEINLPFSIQGQRPDIVERYVRAIERGESHRMAEMLAFRKAPKSMTDSVYLAGRGTLEKQFEGDARGLKAVIEGAKRQGYTPNMNDVYEPGVALSVGDPLAFVPSTNARGHIKSVIESRGMSCDGDVNCVSVKGREPDSDPHEQKHALHPNIVHREIRQRVRQNPEIVHDKDFKELPAKIVHEHALK